MNRAAESRFGPRLQKKRGHPNQVPQMEAVARTGGEGGTQLGGGGERHVGSGCKAGHTHTPAPPPAVREEVVGAVTQAFECPWLTMFPGEMLSPHPPALSLDWVLAKEGELGLFGSICGKGSAAWPRSGSRWATWKQHWPRRRGGAGQIRRKEIGQLQKGGKA